MRDILFLAFLILVSLPLIGQDKKDSNRGVATLNCEYPRQTGELTIIRKDSLKMTVFKTERSELILYDHVEYSTEEADSTDKCINANSMITQLFKNGLLTSDILLQAYLRIQKYLLEDTNGLGKDLANRINSPKDTTKFLGICSMWRKKINQSGIYYKNSVLFQISLTFDKCEDVSKCLPSDSYMMPPISDFTLLLGSDDSKEVKGNLNEYFKKAKIKCLRWQGFEI